MSEPLNAAPQRRPGGRATRVKEAVHRAVLDAVIEHGVDKVGIPDISRRAGVQDSSIYRRWGTRENLILDVMLTFSEQTFGLPDTGTLRGDLTALATALIGYLETPLGDGLARSLAFVIDSDEISQARKAFWDSRYHTNKLLIERAIARGELPSGIDPHLAMELLVSPIHFRHLLAREPVDPSFVDQLVSHVISALRHADEGTPQP
ncbi:TetR/AcrR family transcriptional regulator [Nocardia cyriacigeorgica]|uniref:TetR/AcrR family transcriptional regulator n=1 Tax=Nocardia cyriacigeorgica TaxID=135487 RepID=A0A6P1D155_9NOCA|nr:TetR/AcrR family transcriptional regulator [Nocardia cyriacigeorgica]NEW37712.1 TetR/AcrR family transcriptional regulator [Nocardia cyriacigeorgica]NEW43304.1 TetR/AcrR family transcriptional regulator [Nocardia cyriacigeorgica]NEW48902.1 TetR/AcrR family transcriptional regulator [Nocardia cyriacigeorgica]NEW55003.1 TetR/AcrR family transcriptional regulator [Nocardia cyriacigeorgica]